jgi:predicted TIM-barrel enzyme
VLDMAAEIIPVVERCPVLAGVCGSDPFRVMHVFLKQIAEAGFIGVQNFPSVGLYEARFRREIEAAGLGFGREVEMVTTAHRLDLMTCAFVFDPEEAAEMTAAGADVVVAHLGMSTHEDLDLQGAVAAVQAMHDAAKRLRSDVIVLCHGGPILEPEDVAYVLSNSAGVSGYFGSGSIERRPAELAIERQVRRFKALTTKLQS